MSLLVVAWVGWALAVAGGLALRRRAGAVADAVHELRGAAMAIGLAAERLERGGAVSEFAPVVRLQLARMATALDDLGGPGSAGSSLDAGRLAQVLGNVVANAAEHGVGPVEVRAWREHGCVRLEVRNRERGRASGARRGRGRGIAIAKRAARSLGGRVSVDSERGVTRTVIELPAETMAREAEGPGDDVPRAA